LAADRRLPEVNIHELLILLNATNFSPRKQNLVKKSCTPREEPQRAEAIAAVRMECKA
jgi:hypothetical protein